MHTLQICKHILACRTLQDDMAKSHYSCGRFISAVAHSESSGTFENSRRNSARLDEINWNWLMGRDDIFVNWRLKLCFDINNSECIVVSLDDKAIRHLTASLTSHCKSSENFSNVIPGVSFHDFVSSVNVQRESRTMFNRSPTLIM